MTKTKIYRQGDILIVAVDAIPEGTKVANPTSHLLVAEGEATGHAHVLEAPVIEEHLTTDERFFRIVEGAGLLVHDEHSTVELPPGDYQIRRQREYEEEAPRWVAD